jgi:hypothetical protein
MPAGPTLRPATPEDAERIAREAFGEPGLGMQVVEYRRVP